MKKQIVQCIVHIVTEIVSQAVLLSIILWYYDTNLQDYVVSLAFIVFVILLDYFICNKHGVATPCIIHFFDLIFTIPSMALAIRQILLKVNNGTLPVIVIIFSVNCLVLLERLLLVKKRKGKAK